MKNLVYLSRCALVLAIIGITILALISSDPIQINFAGRDKVEHISAFLTLSALSYSSFPCARFWKSIFPFLLLFGVGIEIAQAFTPDRCPDVKDVAADVVGIICFNIVRAIL